MNKGLEGSIRCISRCYPDIYLARLRKIITTYIRIVCNLSEIQAWYLPSTSMALNHYTSRSISVMCCSWGNKCLSTFTFHGHERVKYLNFKGKFNVECNLIYHLKILRALGYLAVEAIRCTLVLLRQLLYSWNLFLFNLVQDSKVCLEKQTETMHVHEAFVSHDKSPGLVTITLINIILIMNQFSDCASSLCSNANAKTCHWTQPWVHLIHFSVPQSVFNLILSSSSFLDSQETFLQSFSTKLLYHFLPWFLLSNILYNLLVCTILIT